MKAIRITGEGGPEVLKLGDAPEPEVGPGDVLVNVRASALNRADLLQALGRYPAPHGAPADIPGLEYAGEVERVGSKVQFLKPGDRVMGLVGGGAFAERVAVHEREALRVPPSIELAHAAAIPEAFFTAFDAMVLQGQLRSGESALIHAVASGVGTAAVQVARAIGAVAVGTSRSRDKLDRCKKELGLVHAIHAASPPEFSDAVKAVNGRGCDVVLDLVGGDYFAETLHACAPRARWMLVGLLAGWEAALPMPLFLNKRLTLIGTMLRSRTLDEKIAVAQAFERQMLPLFADGRLKPVVDAIVPMNELQRGAERMSSNESFGKVVLTW